MGLKKSLRLTKSHSRIDCQSFLLWKVEGPICCIRQSCLSTVESVFYNMARLSAAGIPQITVVHGSSMCSKRIRWPLRLCGDGQNQAQVYLAGPPVKSGHRRRGRPESLGGAEMHAGYGVLPNTSQKTTLMRSSSHGTSWQSLGGTTITKPPHLRPTKNSGTVPMSCLGSSPSATKALRLPRGHRSACG